MHFESSTISHTFESESILHGAESDSLTNSTTFKVCLLRTTLQVQFQNIHLYMIWFWIIATNQFLLTTYVLPTHSKFLLQFFHTHVGHYFVILLSISKVLGNRKVLVISSHRLEHSIVVRIHYSYVSRSFATFRSLEIVHSGIGTDHVKMNIEIEHFIFLKKISITYGDKEYFSLGMYIPST